MPLFSLNKDTKTTFGFCKSAKAMFRLCKDTDATGGLSKYITAIFKPLSRMMWTYFMSVHISLSCEYSLDFVVSAAINVDQLVSLTL